jgi:thiol-disulfide isomerase/thioredoxin
MKTLSLLLVSLMILSLSCKTTKPYSERKAKVTRSSGRGGTGTATDDSSGKKTWLLGFFNPDQLRNEPYASWYLKGYDDYQLNTEAVNKLFDINKEGLTIKIVMGTWCPDSRREVPRLMRILDIWQFPATSVTFIGVDDSKHSTVADFDKLNIGRVPTFIIYKNNVEAGRIIEIPVTSLEQDMVNILSGNEK